MPVYNAETYLAEAIDSVLRQTLRDVELVVVDDGSQDGSRAIVERFRRADPRVRLVINDENLGVSGARNRGWQLAAAPYIACLDADDVALPDRLSRQVDFLDAHPAVAVVGGGEISIDRAGRPRSIRRYPTSSRVIRSTLLRHNCLGHSSVTMRRSALQAVGGYRFHCVEDYDLWLRLADRFELANLREPVVRQRMHATQRSVALLEQDARDARVVCAAARVRRASGIDPLAGMQELTPEVFDGLEIDEGELAAAVERELIARAAILADVGYPTEARQLIDEATRRIGERAGRAFAATVELKRAESVLRGHRPFAAARRVLLAFRCEPRHTWSLVSAWLGPRMPGGGLLRWT